jgi:hypothetical protein
MRRPLSVTIGSAALLALTGLVCAHSGFAPSAFGQANTVQSRALARFRAEDKCIADATKAFPDHDLISLQKRDGQVDQCLADHKLPPRPHLAPSSPDPTIVEPPKGG